MEGIEFSPRSISHSGAYDVLHHQDHGSSKESAEIERISGSTLQDFSPQDSMMKIPGQEEIRDVGFPKLSIPNHEEIISRNMFYRYCSFLKHRRLH